MSESSHDRVNTTTCLTSGVRPMSSAGPGRRRPDRTCRTAPRRWARSGSSSPTTNMSTTRGRLPDRASQPNPPPRSRSRSRQRQHVFRVLGKVMVSRRDEFSVPPGGFTQSGDDRATSVGVSRDATSGKRFVWECPISRSSCSPTTRRRVGPAPSSISTGPTTSATTCSTRSTCASARW